MNVLFSTTEIYPFLKTGGLGDVSAYIVPALRYNGLDARYFTIGHPRILDALKKKKKIAALTAPIGNSKIDILEGLIDGTPSFVVASDDLYYREGSPYTDASGLDWNDNLERFSILSWAAANLTVSTWIPDIIHANDWHTGLVPAYTKLLEGDHVPKTVFTIHNIAYPGIFPIYEFNKLGLPYNFFNVNGLEYYGKVSFLKSGISYSDAITTVSSTYAKELCSSSKFGMGFEGILTSKEKKFKGILNGVSYRDWSPSTDKHLERKFSSTRLENKVALKEIFLEKTGAPVNKKTFLMCSVTRLVEQKGIDTIITCLKRLAENGSNVMLAILGTGDSHYEKSLKDLERLFPRNLKFYCTYDEKLAHQLIAASDALLVPSLFEPCGLTQMYAMKYGTLPIVTPVGGLKDTVTDESVHKKASGFVAKSPDAEDVFDTISRALALYQQNPERWGNMIQNVMYKRFTWITSAKHYAALYTKLLAKEKQLAVT